MIDAVSSFLTDIRKRTKAIGADVPAFRLSDDLTSYVGTKIPTGNPRIDTLMCGGFPQGRIIEILGPESSGKTTLSLAMIAGALRTLKNCLIVYIDAEHALDISYAMRIGVDPKRVIIQQPDYGEQSLELVKQSCLSRIENKELVDQHLIIVVDSVAAMVPEAEYKSDLISESGGMAQQARMMGIALRQLTGPVNNSNACVVFINQERDSINKHGYGSPITSPGGRALKFYSSIRIRITKIGKWEQGDGIKSKATIIKSKLFPPFQSCEFHIGPNGIDMWMDMIEEAVQFGVVDKAGATFKIGEQKYTGGIIKFRDLLMSNREIAQDVVNKINIAKKSGIKPLKIETETKSEVEEEMSIEDAKEILT